ncbi:MAG: BrnT family toxin, partial [Candidatus Omnitrophica bacterium]|nr:BrnT family toxin [Candidatus Omnitrophota bacterium]
RFVLLGMSATSNLLLVCHCYRANDDEIRIISARKATSNERSIYQEFRP